MGRLPGRAGRGEGRGRPARTVPILATLARELLAHMPRTGRRGDALVFGRTDSEPFVPTTARSRALRMWERENARRMAAAADPDGATPLMPISLHEGRHTYASAFIAARANPKAVGSLMGHAAIRRTDLVASATRTDAWTAREAAGCVRWPALAAVGRFGGGLLPAWIPLLTRPGEDLANSPAPVAVVTPGSPSADSAQPLGARLPMRPALACG